MKDVILPTHDIQMVKRTPVLVHAGPLANIAIGASTIVANRLALKVEGRANMSGQQMKMIIDIIDLANALMHS
jgi:methylenetetrahydrofolate dehydrogenase (NADP+)/methenyltetrahydrofolate cyclohydrolase/formyltetrahydrofolate synthetase